MTKDLQLTSIVKNQLMTWAGTHNLNRLIDFHNYVRELFGVQLQDLKNCVNSKDNNLTEATLYDYDRMLHVNTFLMMFSYLEEWLYICWKSYIPDTDTVDKEGSLGRFKKIVKKRGVDLESKLWQDLKNVEEIRDCLLHANGRISLLKDPKKRANIERIVAKNNLGLKIDNDRIQISSDYLHVLNGNISAILDTIINYENRTGYS